MISLLMGGVSSAALISSISSFVPVELRMARTYVIMGQEPNAVNLKSFKVNGVIGTKVNAINLQKHYTYTIVET